MNKIQSAITALSIMLAVVACQQTSKPTESNILFNKDSMLHDVKMLASDSFQGRKPFSAGETKAVDFIKTSFTNMGLEPGNGNSYLQDVPMVEITPKADAVMLVQSTKGNFELKNTEDFVASTEKTESGL